ncbi:MAG: flavin-containing monooxygenase [Nocardioides sp.]
MTRDVIVIGAGQSGLALGASLAAVDLDFLLLDGADQIGSSWRARWDSLRLFTPARYSSLPGLSFPGDPDRYPGKDEVADYLADYAREFDLPARLGVRVRQLRHTDDVFEVVTTAGSLRASRVVVATGPYQRPVVPRHSLAVPSIHAAEYRSPNELPDGPVVVVGGGNSGCQIAAEVASTGRQVHLAVGRGLRGLPQRVLGQDVFGLLDAIGVIDAPATGWLGARIRDREPVIGTTARRLRRRGVRMVDRVVSASGSTLTTHDGSALDVSAMIWATGYRLDHSWIDIPGATKHGSGMHSLGVSPIPGLHYLGLGYLRSRGSALLGWVGRDAALLADRLTGNASDSRPPV